MPQEHRNRNFDLLRRLGDEPREVGAARAYESARVAFVVNRCWPEPLRKRTRARLEQLNAERYGARSLTFQTFNDEFPSFPVVLACDHLGGLQLHRDNGSVFPLWFARFPDLPFVAPFEASVDAARASLAGRGAGLVFPRKGFAQGMVVHTPVAGVTFRPGVCVVWTRPPERGGREHPPVYVRAFSALVDAVAASWEPPGPG